MLTTRSLAAVAVALLLSCASVDRSAARERALRDLENHWLQVENDPDALESILADDFVHVLPVGFVTKAEQLRFMRQHPPPTVAESRRFEDLRVRLFGDTGVVHGIVVATAKSGAVRKTIFTDIFAYRNGRWQAVSAQELPLPSAEQTQRP
jgi:hypothetical protein